MQVFCHSLSGDCVGGVGCSFHNQAWISWIMCITGWVWGSGRVVTVAHVTHFTHTSTKPTMCHTWISGKINANQIIHLSAFALRWLVLKIQGSGSSHVLFVSYLRNSCKNPYLQHKYKIRFLIYNDIQSG